MTNKLTKFIVYSALFLTPFFTLPFTANTLDFQKQFFLFIVAGLGIFFWMRNAINEKKTAINLDPLHYLIGGLAMIILASSIFSLYSYGSFWGMPLPVAESFLSILSFAFLYFLVVNNFKKEEIPKLAAVVAVSAAVAAAFAVIQSFGIYLLPFFDYTKVASFNTVGSIAGLALYSAIVLALIFPLMFFGKKSSRILFSIPALLLFLTLVVFNGAAVVYFPQKTGGNYDLLLAPWVVLAIAALSVFVFLSSSLKFSSQNPRVKSGAFALFFVAVLFLVFNIFAKPMMAGAYSSVFRVLNISVAPEIGLQPIVAAGIAVDVLKQSPQHFFLGSGPGTFAYDFVKFKPQELNRDDFAWNRIFFAGSSEIINRVATIGVLGIVVLLLIIAAWTVRAFRNLTEEKENEILPLAVFSGWLAVVAAMFFYPFNFSLALLFWLFLAMIIVLSPKKMALLSFDSVRLSYAVALIFIMMVVLQIGLLVWVSKRYYAEVQYVAAVSALQKNDIYGAVEKLELAAEATNRLQDNYLTGLSQVYLAQAREALQKEGQDAQTVFNNAAPYLQTAVTAAAMSTDAANPSNSANWAVRGYIYRQLIGVSDGFDTWAVDMYQKAIDLEPNNPTLWTEIGQVYVLKDDLNLAQKSFGEAIALRPQYIDPHYYLALIYDEQNNKEAAINELEIIWQLLPQDDVASKENVAKAIQNLQQGGLLNSQAESQPNLLPVSEDDSPVTDTLEQGVFEDAVGGDVLQEEIGQEAGEAAGSTSAEDL